MKYSNTILISIIISINLISIETVYSAPPIPTKYDKKQDKRIDKNEKNIEKNTEKIDKNEDNIKDNAKDIATNTTNITTNTNNITTNTNDISTLTNKAVLYDDDGNVKLEKNLVVDGNLDVLGIVDPEALILVPQTTSPSEEIGTIYYNNTNIGSFMFKDKSGWRNYGNELNNHEDRLNDHEGRIGDLEETQFNIVPEVQFIRGKNHTVSAYTKYNVRHNKIPEVGLRITVGLGKSWTQEELEKMEEKLSKLEALIEKGLKYKAGRDVEVKK